MAFEGFREIGWFAVFLYVAATALRLARFNILAPKTNNGFFLRFAMPCCSYACCDFHLDSH